MISMQPIDEEKYKQYIDETFAELKLIIPNVRIIDDPTSFGYNRKGFVTTDYSLADYFRMDIKEYHFSPDYLTLEWQIQFFFIPSLSDETAIVEILCRHKEWGKDLMHLAVEEQGYEITNKPFFGGKIYHPESLDNLVSFYAKQGVKPILLNEMEKSVRELRLQRPIK